MIMYASIGHCAVCRHNVPLDGSRADVHTYSLRTNFLLQVANRLVHSLQLTVKTAGLEMHSILDLQELSYVQSNTCLAKLAFSYCSAVGMSRREICVC